MSFDEVTVDHIGFKLDFKVQWTRETGEDTDDTEYIESCLDINNKTGVIAMTRGKSLAVDTLSEFHNKMLLCSKPEAVSGAANSDDDDSDEAYPEYQPAYSIKLDFVCRFVKVLADSIVFGSSDEVYTMGLGSNGKPGEIQRVGEFENIADIRACESYIVVLAGESEDTNSLYLVSDKKVNKLTDSRLVNSCSSMCLSTDLKSVFVGLSDGLIAQYLIEKNEVKILNIEKVDEIFKAVSLCAIDSSNLLATFDFSVQPNPEYRFGTLSRGEERFISYIINIDTLRMTEAPVGTNADDIEKDFYRYPVVLSDWQIAEDSKVENLVVIATTINNELAVITNESFVLPSEDYQRGTILSNDETFDDEIVCGFAVDLKFDGNPTEVPQVASSVDKLPVFWVLTCTGLLYGYAFYNSIAAREKTPFVFNDYQLSQLPNENIKAYLAASEYDVAPFDALSENSEGEVTPSEKSVDEEQLVARPVQDDEKQIEDEVEENDSEVGEETEQEDLAHETVLKSADVDALKPVVYKDAEVDALKSYVAESEATETKEYVDESFLTFQEDIKHILSLRVANKEPQLFKVESVEYPKLSQNEVSAELERLFYDTMAEFEALAKNQSSMEEFVEENSQVRNFANSRFTDIKNVYTWTLSESEELSKIIGGEVSTEAKELLVEVSNVDKQVSDFLENEFKTFIGDYEKFADEFEKLRDLKKSMAKLAGNNSRILPIEFAMIQKSVASKFNKVYKLFQDLKTKLLELKTKYSLIQNCSQSGSSDANGTNEMYYKLYSALEIINKQTIKHKKETKAFVKDIQAIIEKGKASEKLLEFSNNTEISRNVLSSIKVKQQLSNEKMIYNHFQKSNYKSTVFQL